MIRSTQQTLYRLDNLNNEQQRITYQMSTGKKLQQGSDDANTYAREIHIDDKIRMYEGLQSQIEKTTAQNNASDAALADAKDLVAYVKTEVIKALNATTDDTAKLAIATNLEGVKENLYMLANEEVEGEFLFSGSDSSVQSFTMDETTGKVTYNGDALLRKVAVEEGSYRERGVNGFEAFFYTTNSAYKGETLNFTADQRIVDQDGNEWELNGSGDALLRVDDNSIVHPNSVTNDGLTPPTYSIDMDVTDGTKFEAKANIFDTIDSIINSLKKVDDLGNPITDDESNTVLRNGLTEITEAYDGMNIAHGKLGGRNQVFETSLERVSAKVTQYNILYQEVGAADLSKVAVEAKALELTYTALYSTINKMNELSLVNFVR